jgi:hypothetical protein
VFYDQSFQRFDFVITVLIGEIRLNALLLQRQEEIANELVRGAASF